MGPRHRVDAVDLHKTDAADQIGKRGSARGSGRGLGQGVPVQKQPSGGIICQGRLFCHVTQASSRFSTSKPGNFVTF